MQAFPKASGDHSVDFLTLQFDSLDKANNYPEHIYCFKGGQTFGTKRLYLGSADYLLHTPTALEKTPTLELVGLDARLRTR